MLKRTYETNIGILNYHFVNFLAAKERTDLGVYHIPHFAGNRSDIVKPEKILESCLHIVRDEKTYFQEVYKVVYPNY